MTLSRLTDIVCAVTYIPTTVMVCLKIFKVLDWNWFTVTAPLWGAAVFAWGIVTCLVCDSFCIWLGSVEEKLDKLVN